MTAKDDLFINIGNITVGGNGNNEHPAHLEYDFAKAMIPIYVFHRYQGCDEEDAKKKAFKEMAGIINSVIEKHTTKKTQQDQTARE